MKRDLVRCSECGCVMTPRGFKGHNAVHYGNATASPFEAAPGPPPSLEAADPAYTAYEEAWEQGQDDARR